MIAFGPEPGNLLYIGLGDGGFGGDPQQTGRNTGVILAKMLRIDPEPDGVPNPPYGDCGNDPCGYVSDVDFDYTIPADNPFVDDNNFAPEIYAWGFRNPWRFSFDPDNGDLYVADVGQGDWEEVDIVVAGGDYGWSSMEGFHCFNGGCDEVMTPNAVNADGMTMPITEYSHAQANRCSITGGGVYRSCEVPAWDGLYLYGDVCSQELLAAAWDGTATQEFDAVLDVGESILGNGWNAWGDVYITTAVGSYGTPSSDGRVYRVAPVAMR
jgi:glucose/arabinose dehydrogenase